MYEAAGDPYCYKGTSVLRNIPGFRDHERLERFETVMVAERARESLPRGALTIGHYRSVHRHLFQDVYRWAGRYRSVRIHKEGSTFCYPEHIPGQMKALFSRLREAEFYADWHLRSSPARRRISSPTSMPFIPFAKAMAAANCRSWR